MKRLRSLSLLALFAGAPLAAQAQPGPDYLSAEVQGGAEYTSNARLAGEGAEETDTVFLVHPSVAGKVERRGFEATLRYDLRYWHYQQFDDLDRMLHDLDARAALLWFESVDVELYERLLPTPLSLADPLDNPVSNVQSSHAGARLAYRRAFGPSTRATVGYTGERVDYIEVHKNDPRGAEYFLHDPGFLLERDLGKRATLGLDYRYRVQQFDDANAPATGDLQAHVVTLRPAFSPNEWLTLDGALGVQAVDFEESSVDDDVRVLVDVRVRADGEAAGIEATYSDRTVQDLAGNSIGLRLARLGARYDDPGAPWGVHAGAAYGTQDLVADPVSGVDPSRTFVSADAGASYRISSGTLSLIGNYHQTLEEDAAPAVSVTRISLVLGGRF